MALKCLGATLQVEYLSQSRDIRDFENKGWLSRKVFAVRAGWAG
jgi:hypothetical protein